MTRRIGLLSLLTGVAGLWLVAPSAASAAATVGAADLSGTPVEQCGGLAQTCNFVPLNTPSGAEEPGSPITGVITSLRMRTTGGAVTFMIRPVRKNATMALTFLNVGPEVAFPVAADGNPVGHITEANGVHLPITAGDRLGLGYTNVSPAPMIGAIGGARACGSSQGPGNTHPVGTEKTYSTGCPAELLVQGTAEPDADHDGFGDETQDQCPTNAGTQGPCPVSATPVDGSARPVDGEDLLSYVTTSKLKLKKRIAYRFVCSTECQVTATTTLVLRGPDVGPIVDTDLFPAGQVIEVFLKPNKSARKSIRRHIGASKLRTSVTAVNPSPYGETDTDTRIFRFRR
ncbi:MAG TPA: hypothetical protein VIZ61_12775 [Solirubrobacterales bacterium]